MSLLEAFIGRQRFDLRFLLSQKMSIQINFKRLQSDFKVKNYENLRYFLLCVISSPLCALEAAWWCKRKSNKM